MVSSEHQIIEAVPGLQPAVYPCPKLYPSLHLSYSTNPFLIPALPIVTRFFAYLSSASWLGPENTTCYQQVPLYGWTTSFFSTRHKLCLFLMWVHAAPNTVSAQQYLLIKWWKGKLIVTSGLDFQSVRGDLGKTEEFLFLKSLSDWVLCHPWKNSAWISKTLNCLNGF